MSRPQLKKVKLGELLVEGSVITNEKLQQALKISQEKGEKLGNVLIELGYLTETRLANALAVQLNIPFIDLKHYPLRPDIIRKLPEKISRRYRVLLVDIIQNENLIGMEDPTDLVAYDEVVRLLGPKLKVAVVTDSDLMRTLDLVYRRTEDIVSFAKELKEELGKTEALPEADIISAEAAPVSKLLDSIFEDAVQIGASDIHIEPDEKFLRIRQRVDGVLHEHIVHGKEIVSALVLRIKLIANLNISERRLPQDGRFLMEVKGRNIDVRLSTMPVYYGESVVMRLLDKSGGLFKIEQLGMPEPILERILYLIQKPYGMMLVTGPTGSGKTTTLYAALTILNTPEKKIISIEDPVEYTIPRVNQVQVNPAIGLTFASVLRSSLRQDPDIVMVGEMRDEETVQIGLRASMTGHMVLSTLHTNDSISSAVRLLDMGAQGFLLAGALRGILSQRLVRRICDACIEDYKPNPQEQSWLEMLGVTWDPSIHLKFGKGCSRCNNTGYRGRIGVYELLEMDENLSDALRANDTKAFTHIAESQQTFKPLTQAALDYALQGITTITEVFRIAGEAF